MAFIPKDAIWYLADIVEELRIVGRKTQHVYINTVLIRANSPQEAYAKSLKIGREAQHSYKNMYGEKVICKFRGLRQLSVVDWKLEHGCELFYNSKPRQTEKGIRRMLNTKKQLQVFADMPHSNGKFVPQDIAKELKQQGFTRA